jgi:hypothetical protein
VNDRGLRLRLWLECKMGWFMEKREREKERAICVMREGAREVLARYFILWILYFHGVSILKCR